MNAYLKGEDFKVAIVPATESERQERDSLKKKTIPELTTMVFQLLDQLPMATKKSVYRKVQK